MSNDQKHEDIFAGLVAYMNISEHSVRGFDPSVTLSLCNDELGLLPNWMFRADMISVMLLQKRCFDVIYERNDNAVCSLAFSSQRDSEASFEIKETYAEYPYDPDLPKSLLCLIAATAVVDSVKIDPENKQVEILPINGFFRMPENGKALAFPGLQTIEGYLLHKLGHAVKQHMGRDFAPYNGLTR